MEQITEERLSFIEDQLAKCSLPPDAYQIRLCEALRAAWAERAKAVELAGGWQKEHRLSENDAAQLRIERDAAREQVRQFQTALEKALSWWAPLVAKDRFRRGGMEEEAVQECRAVLKGNDG